LKGFSVLAKDFLIFQRIYFAINGALGFDHRGGNLSGTKQFIKVQ